MHAPYPRSDALDTINYRPLDPTSKTKLCCAPIARRSTRAMPHIEVLPRNRSIPLKVFAGAGLTCMSRVPTPPRSMETRDATLSRHPPVTFCPVAPSLLAGRLDFSHLHLPGDQLQ